MSVDVLSVEILLYSLFTCHPQAKEKQEELAMDMKILEKLLDDTRNEVKEETQRKVCSCLKWFQYFSNVSLINLFNFSKHFLEMILRVEMHFSFY